jgi:NitT/TauT family transport system substrate-binding protein
VSSRPPASFLLALGLAALACSGDRPDTPPPNERPRVRLQLNWFPEPEFGGMYAARERGIFARNGLEVQLLEGGADVPAAQLVAAGRVELAVVAAEQLLTLRAAGGRARAVFACFQTSPRVVVVRGDSTFRSLSDLWRSDAVVMAAEGLAFVKYLNARHGGEWLELVPYAGSATPLIAGSVDAMQGFATAEPVQLELDGVEVRSFLVADEGFSPYDVVVVANEEWLEREPEAARAVVVALREGWRSYLDDPGPVNAIMAERNRDMSREVMDRSASLLDRFVESEDTGRRGLGWMSADRWRRLGAQLRSLDILDTEPDPEEVFVNLLDASARPLP